jgi:HK97 family phage prohead protease
MPMPMPNSGESREDFHARCMGDEMMNEEFPDAAQRRAVCQRQWDGMKNAAAPMRLTTRLEIKSLSAMQFEGHGAVAGNVDYGGDVILAGAFQRTLARHKSEDTVPAMFWMHNETQVPGKWLDLREDDKGLAVKGELAPTDLGKEIHTLLKMQAVSGLSIGYLPLPGSVEYDDSGVRILKEVELFEVSIVALPMNPKAQIAHVKSRLSANGEYVPREDEVADLKRALERFLRDKGFSKKLAIHYASNLFNGAGAMPEPKNDHGGTPAVNRESKGETPEEIEVNAGLSDFRARQTLYELDKRLKRYMR